MAQSDEEEDWMTMTFEDAPKGPKHETAMQRAARKRKEAEARSRQKTKAEREADAEAAQENALDTPLPETSKGFKMMAKFGFKQGDALGKSENARKEPIRVTKKDDRGGIGVESEKKRKIREEFEKFERAAKKSKEEEFDYHAHRRKQRKDEQAEWDLKNAQKTAERLSERDDERKGISSTAEKPLKNINVLWRGRVRSRREAERDKKQQQDRLSSLGTGLPKYVDNDEDDDPDLKVAMGRDLDPHHSVLEDDFDDEDPELAEFEALPLPERVSKVLVFLRENFKYCLYCGHDYDDAAMNGCPGVTREDHDD